MKISDAKKMHELYAQYWMTMASTGACKNRNVQDGSGRKLTDDELVNDALGCALAHIHNFIEAAENEFKAEHPDPNVEAPQVVYFSEMGW